MKEVIQLNLTKEESEILQGMSKVGFCVLMKDMIEGEISVHRTLRDINKYPDAAESLAKKMVELSNITINGLPE